MIGDLERGTRGWVALVDSHPVSKVVLHVEDGVAGIYGVATTDDGRGRGLATLLCATGLDAARAAGAHRVARVELLGQLGPALGRPAVDNVHHSRHPNMKELRSERALRVLCAFDPRRTAILLIGGDKSPDNPGSPNWNRWYERYIPIADDLYDTHLRELHEEGLT